MLKAHLHKGGIQQEKKTEDVISLKEVRSEKVLAEGFLKRMFPTSELVTWTRNNGQTREA